MSIYSVEHSANQRLFLAELTLISQGLRACTSVPAPLEVPKFPLDLAQTCSLDQPFPELYSKLASFDQPQPILRLGIRDDLLRRGYRNEKSALLNYIAVFPLLRCDVAILSVNLGQY